LTFSNFSRYLQEKYIAGMHIYIVDISFIIENGQKKRTDYTMAKGKGQTMQWPKEKDRLYNGQKKRTDYTMAKRKGQTIQ
jgi:hypothetical protein